MVQLAVEPVQGPREFFCLDRDLGSQIHTQRCLAQLDLACWWWNTHSAQRRKRKRVHRKYPALHLFIGKVCYKMTLTLEQTSRTCCISHLKSSDIYIYTLYILYGWDMNNKPQEIKTVEGKHSHEARVTALVIQSSTWKLGCEIVYQQQIQKNVLYCYHYF